MFFYCKLSELKKRNTRTANDVDIIENWLLVESLKNVGDVNASFIIQKYAASTLTVKKKQCPWHLEWKTKIFIYLSHVCDRAKVFRSGEKKDEVCDTNRKINISLTCACSYPSFRVSISQCVHIKYHAEMPHHTNRINAFRARTETCRIYIYIYTCTCHRNARPAITSRPQLSDRVDDRFYFRFLL